jgi:alkylated DNA nucleotide flippase Atl1
VSKYERVISVSRTVPPGYWTSYQVIGEIVYGHRKAGQAVGSIIRAEGCVDTSHRTLLASGRVSEQWRGDRGGPEECVRRLCDEDAWDKPSNRARAERFLDVDAFAQRG